MCCKIILQKSLIYFTEIENKTNQKNIKGNKNKK